MNRMIILGCIGLMITGNSFANGGLLPEERSKIHQDTIQSKSSSIDKKTTKEVNENPRNPAMVESFGNVGNKSEKEKPEK